jgi:hypothetical protein
VDITQKYLIPIVYTFRLIFDGGMGEVLHNFLQNSNPFTYLPPLLVVVVACFVVVESERGLSDMPYVLSFYY